MKEQNLLRNTLGVLGILLPILTLTFNLLFGKEYNPSYVLSSISATHYSSAYLLFEGLVFSVGLFLITYRGYDIVDYISSTIAGIGAIGLSLFPCALEGAETRNFMMLPQGITNVIHLISAGLFFTCLIYIIGFQFTKTNKRRPMKRKLQRNALYNICAVLMTCSLIIGFGSKELVKIINFDGASLVGWIYSVFIGEAVALCAFGIAWLTKGGVILKDLEG